MGEMMNEGQNLGDNIDLSQFYQVFFEEAGENLQNMEQLLLELDIDAGKPAVATQRNVDIIAKPGRQANVPPAPKIAKRGGEIRRSEIGHEVEAQQS